MALLDIFKKKETKKPVKKTAPKKSEVHVAETKKEVKKEVKKETEKPVAVPLKTKKTSPVAYRILKGPHITEKATDLTSMGQYVFDVYEKANKSEIKKTIEDIYGVGVVSLKIIKIPPKKRRLGKIEGWRQGYKKAIIRLAQGQKIEILPR